MSNDPKSFGDLKRLLAASPRGAWPSRVNPSMTHTQALDVLTAAVATRPDAMLIADDVRGDLMTRNVLRECRVRHD